MNDEQIMKLIMDQALTQQTLATMDAKLDKIDSSLSEGSEKFDHIMERLTKAETTVEMLKWMLGGVGLIAGTALAEALFDIL